MEIRTRTTPPSLSSALISHNKTVTKRQSDPAKAQPPQTPCFSFGSVASPATNFMTMAASTRQAQLMNHISELCRSVAWSSFLSSSSSLGCRVAGNDAGVWGAEMQK